MPREARLMALNSLAESIIDKFPEGAEYNIVDGADRNFVISWPLKGQPEHLTQISREVSIRFDRAFLDHYAGLDAEQRAPYKTLFGGIIDNNISSFSDGRDTPRGGVKEPWILDTAHHLEFH